MLVFKDSRLIITLLYTCNTGGLYFMKVNIKKLQAHFKISRSTFYEIFTDSNPHWQDVDAKISEANGGREVHIPSGEALRPYQALAYLSGEGLAINRTTLWRKEKSGDITPIAVTSDIKLFVKSDLDNLLLDNLLKPFCHNIADIAGLDTPCLNNKHCKFKDCTWYGFFEII